MQTSFEEHGRWWLPDHETHKNRSFYGKLSWSPTRGAKLAALGLSEEITAALSSCLGRSIRVQGQLDIDGIEMRIALWNQMSFAGRRFSAESVNTLELHSEEPFRYEKGRHLLDEFKAFLTLALDRPVLFKAIRGK
ncbi:MAG: hypothetical protein WDN28_03915 [Chthoniobacter sp.]